MSRPSALRRHWFAKVTALAVFVGVVVVPLAASSPASADGEQSPVHLTPGKTTHIQAKPISVPGYAATRRSQGEQTPANCRSTASSYCDLYPLVIDAPASVIQSSQWIVTATLNYDPGQTVRNVPGVGDATTEGFSVRLYYDPPCDATGAPPCPKDATDTSTGEDGNGDHYAAASATFAPPPLQIGVAQADFANRKMAVSVAFYYGTPEPYTLDVNLLQVGTYLPPDSSADEAIAVTGSQEAPSPPPKDLSATPAAPAAAPTPPAAPVAAPAAPPAAPAGPQFGSGDVTGLGDVNGTSLAGDQLAGLFTGKSRAALPRAGKASALALILFLLVLPILAVALPTGWMWRRRQSSLG